MFFDVLPSLLNELILSKIIEEKYLRKKNVVIYKKEDLKYYFLQTGRELNTKLKMF